MAANEEELGPIDIVVIGYPADAPLTGDAAPYLLDLVDRGIIRVLDVLFVMEGEDGTFSGFEATDLSPESLGDFHVFAGASTGMLGADDVDTVAEHDRARHGGARDHVREPLGRAVRGRGAPQRRRADRQPADPARGRARRARRDRSQLGTERTRMPLLRGIARTAVIAGTATTVSNRVSRRQANKWSQQDAEQAPQQEYAPPPEPAAAPAAPTESRVDKLTQLAALKEQGVLTDAEFAAEKARILQS